MRTRIEVGTAVVHNRGTQRMTVKGLGEIEGREHAWCEWRDKDGTPKSQQFPVEELALAVDRGPPGGPWAAARIKKSDGED
jgi:hypothetical protein